MRTFPIAVSLGGDDASAEAILARTDSLISGWFKKGPQTPDLSVQLAFLRAAEGNEDEAMALLSRGVSAGWLPDRRFHSVDIADEPALARLVSRPEFQALRRRILARIEEERRKVPLDLLHRAFPLAQSPKQAAA